jgi:hypothetical protein
MTNEEWYGYKIYSSPKKDGDIEKLENKKGGDPVFKDKNELLNRTFRRKWDFTTRKMI